MKRALGASPHLVPPLVREIRAKLAAGVPQSEVARQYCVSRQCIHYIAKGKTWKQVR